MQTIQIEGLATISNHGFHFDSGLPSNEPIVDEARKMHGTMKISTNACADFEASDRVILPPQIHQVSQGEGYNIKRTSRHYLLQIKVPVLESRLDTNLRIKRIIPCALGDITLDRQEVIAP